MASDKIIQLVESLKKATNEGRLHWSETSSDGKFCTSLGVAVLEIERETRWQSPGDMLVGNKRSEYSYVIYIKDMNAEKTLDIEFFDPKDEKYNDVQQLYVSARRDALNLDQILDAMIANAGGVT